MPPAIFGLSDGLSGAIVGVVVFIVAVAIIIGVFVWIEDHSLSRYPSDGSYRSPAGEGILNCLYVDAKFLASIAGQLNIDLGPVKIERATGEKRTTSKGFSRLLFWRRSKETSTGERAYYEITKDPNKLLGAVLEELENRSTLRRCLEYLPSMEIWDEDFLDEILATARNPSETDQARHALETLTSRRLANSKSEQFKHAAEVDNGYALVESKWKVKEKAGLLVLHLTALRSEDDVDRFIDIPDEISLCVPLTQGKERLTPQGLDHLTESGKEIRAGVFGNASAFDEQSNSLTFSAVAIFTRRGNEVDWRGGC